MKSLSFHDPHKPASHRFYYSRTAHLVTFSFPPLSLLISPFYALLSSGYHQDNAYLSIDTHTYPYPFIPYPPPPSLDWFVVSKYVAAIIRTLVLGKIIILFWVAPDHYLSNNQNTMASRFR